MMMGTVSRRDAPLDMTPETFRRAGHALVDRVAEFLGWIQDRSNPVTRGENPQQIRDLLGDPSLPQTGTPAEQLMADSAALLFEHSLFNGHPRFWGYVTAPPAPIGVLGDMLASAVNPNVGAFPLSPVATEIEKQVVRWIAEMIGYPPSCGGLLVSGGNMANFIGFLAARKAKVPWDARTEGLAVTGKGRLRVYCSEATHTWIQKATDLFGLGHDAIGYIPVDNVQRMDVAALRRRIVEDRAKGEVPLLVIGNAGTVGTGAVDSLGEIASICRENNLWFHVDGAYGGFAAMLPEAPADLKAFSMADSVAVDPHKWLYAPLEVGCVLVKERQALLDTFMYRPAYYRFDGNEEELTNFHELGMQNSRGFRALKVWLAIRHVGKEGYMRMLRDDCRLTGELFASLAQYPELQPLTLGLSIATFRYVPRDLAGDAEGNEEYLNTLNAELLTRLQKTGAVYPSNAIVQGRFAIRVCIVNFRTTREDILSLLPLAVTFGLEADRELRRARVSPQTNVQ
jgi:aromatic-L-amino-acid/L-tryptophan decarboxylase